MGFSIPHQFLFFFAFHRIMLTPSENITNISMCSLCFTGYDCCKNPITLKPTKQFYKLHNCNRELVGGIYGFRRQVKIVEASIPFVLKTIQGLRYCVICYRASIIVKFVPHKSVEQRGYCTY